MFTLIGFVYYNINKMNSFLDNNFSLKIDIFNQPKSRRISLRQSNNNSNSIRKLLSLNPSVSKSKGSTNSISNHKIELNTKNNNLRSLSNDVKRIKNPYGTNFSKKRKKVKFHKKFVDLVEIESHKQYFLEDENEEEEINLTGELPINLKKTVKIEELPLKNNYNHKLNSKTETRAKCCVCNFM